MTSKLDISVRPIKSSELFELALIDRLCFEESVRKSDIEQLIQKLYNGHGAAVVDGVPVGYFIYELLEDGYEILRLCVDPEFRNKGVGKAMIEKIVSMLNNQRNLVYIDTPDTLIGAHLFLRKQNFAAKTLKGDNSTYRFFYRKHPENS